MNIRHHFGTRPFLIDISGILLFLILGGGGLVVMAAPHWVFSIFVPMLTPRDWPVAEDRPKTRLYHRHFGRQQSRVYFSIEVEEAGGAPASINQQLHWYANTIEAAHAWQRDTADAATNPFATTFPDVTQPPHLFVCRNRRSCTYYAYAGHWYMLVRFEGNNEARLTLAQMEQLAGLAGERLQAAAGR